MKVRYIIFNTLCIMGMFLAPRAAAVSSYEVLSNRASRFFEQKEWAQAAAVYNLMLDLRPEVTATYGPAIVSNVIRGDSLAEISLMQKALDNHIPFDSVFSRVRQTSFSLGKTSLYERFMLNVRGAFPWMKRTVDGHLLKYYAFRKNGRMMVTYSNIMLVGAPDNVDFLTLRGQGLFLQNLDAEAVETYKHILRLDPNNYHALVVLGNWYTDRAGKLDRAAGRAYLEQADALRPTPYVTARLKEL